MADDTNTAERRMLQEVQRIAKQLRYEDGKVFWIGCKRTEMNGREAGRRDSNGYLRIHVHGGPMVPVHRIVYFMHHGFYPQLIDHIDGDPSNNRIENLRPATRAENCRNCKTPVTNTSGVKGVYWHKQTSRWTASIRIEKRLSHLGTFADFFDAICARKSAERKHYGEFAR